MTGVQTCALPISRIKNASLYPMVVMFFGIISIALVVRFVMPKILDTILESGIVLPWPTRLLLGTSDFLQKYGLILVVAVVLIFVLYRKFRKRTDFRFIIDSLKLKVPVFGNLIKTISVGRFARTLGSLLSSGITVLEALSVVKDTLGNVVLGQEIDKVSEKVKAGLPLSEPLAESGLFPPLLVQIVSVGENTGTLDELLLNAADTFDETADSAIEKFMALFPVVLIILLGGIVLLLVLATLLPILLDSMRTGSI